MGKNKTETVIEPIDGKITSDITLSLEDEEITEADVIEEAEDDWGDKPHPNFIESNTSSITLEDLANNSIVPTFSDSALTISHQNFIESVVNAGREVFGELTPVEIRVSHEINGRVPTALHKKPSELLESEKTVYYQRMAFVCHVHGLTRSINGETVHLCIGGCRAYNEDRLYNRQSPMKFKVFVGWQVRVCSNLMLTCDGNSGTIECMSETDIYKKSLDLFGLFDPKKENILHLLENLKTTSISEELFCKIIGRMKLYQVLPSSEQRKLPLLAINDQGVNAMVKSYVSNPNFGKKEGEDITAWNLLQLGTEAIKSSYIDSWVQRSQNVTDFAIGVQKAIDGEDTEGYSWFLN